MRRARSRIATTSGERSDVVSGSAMPQPLPGGTAPKPAAVRHNPGNPEARRCAYAAGLCDSKQEGSGAPPTLVGLFVENGRLRGS